MALTQEQIANLYAFTRAHFVEYYDLQTELVDHMANDIEVSMAENPHTTFEEARDKSFKKFGVFGFMEVVEQRQKAMNKTYMKLLWHYAKDWFKLPQIILTTAIFVSLYTLLLTEVGSYVLVASYVVLCVWLILKTILYNKKIKDKRKRKAKIWLLEDMIFRNASLNALIIVPQLFNVVNHVNIIGSSKSLIYAALFTMTIIYTYISTLILPKNATFHLQKTYPEYSM